MDVVASLVGALAGVLSAVLPGLHPNAIASVVTMRPGGSAEAFALVAMGGAFAVAAPTAGALLGASEESALSASPTQRLLAEGRAREAAEIAADAALLGVALALPLAALLAAVLRRNADAVSALAPLGVAALLVLLVRGSSRRTAALVVLLLAGALGVLALRIGVRSPVGLPASALLPLLGGLFGAPALLALARASARSVQKAYRAVEPFPRALAVAGRGAVCGALVGLLPATTPGVAVAAVAARPRRDEESIGLLAAATGAGAVFSLSALFALGRARNGTLVAARALDPPSRWIANAPPPEAVAWAAALLLGSIVAWLAGRAFARAIPALAEGVPLPALGAAGLALLLASVALAAGIVGLVVAGTGCALAIASSRAGVPRTVLLASLLVPALLALVGLR